MPKYDLIANEIEWCKSHRNPEQEVYQDGFIAGLQHALFLMKSSPTLHAAEQKRAVDVAKACGDFCGNCKQSYPCGCGEPHQMCGVCAGSLAHECHCTERDFATSPRN